MKEKQNIEEMENELREVIARLDEINEELRRHPEKDELWSEETKLLDRMDELTDAGAVSDKVKLQLERLKEDLV